MSPDTSTSQTPTRTLRVALAMRGGVSMAVWIGGVIAELDLLRRATDDTPDTSGRAKIYRELLGEAHYKGVEFDILAGASAGGLNAVLFALAQSYGVVTDSIVRSTWENDGGLWDLLRSPSDNAAADRWSGFRAVDSVLSGDGRFLTLAVTAVNRIAAAPRLSKRQPPQALSVELAATLLPDPDKQVTTGRGGFSFTRRPGGLSSAYSTIPGLGDDESAAEVARQAMALAIRSTSSFPGAFEPATVYSIDSPEEIAPNSGGKPNMDRVFPFARAATGNDTAGSNTVSGEAPFLVIDGGVFDNIPIDRAIRAIQRAPASAPTERVLMYLDPQPPAQPEPIPVPATDDAQRRVLAKQTAQLSRWLNVIRSGMSMKSRQESAEDEITYIREHNDSVLALRGRTEELAAWLGTTKGPLPSIPVSRYIQSRIGSDAQHYSEILTAPHTMLFTPPFPAEPRTPIEPLLSLRIKDALAQAYTRVTPGSTAAGSDSQAQSVMTRGDVTAAIDATQFLIAWARALEGAGKDAASALKPSLYRCGAVLLQARHLTVDTELASVAATPKRWTDALVDGIAAQGRLTISTEVNCALKQGNSVDDAAFYSALSPSMTASGIGFTSGADSSALLTTLWGHLDEHLAALVTNSAEADEEFWNESLYRALAQNLPENSSYTSYNIARLIAASGGPDTQSVIRYHQITGDEPPATADSDYLKALRADAVATQLEAWLKHDTAIDAIDPQQLSEWMAKIDGLERAEDKLCGTPLARFAGFLDWRWRASDWRWGRVNAASGIVDLLLPDDPRADAEQKTRQDARRYYKKRLQNEIVAEDPDAQAIPARGLGAITDLPSSYRVGLVSRASGLVIRALQPASIFPSPVKKSVVILGVALLRVIPVLLGLIVDPLRLLIALAATLLTSFLLPGDSETGPALWYTVSFLTVIIGGLLFLRSLAADSKWRNMNRRLEQTVTGGPHESWLDALHFAEEKTRRWRQWTAAVGVGCIAAAVITGVLTGERVVTRYQIEPLLIVWVLVAGGAITLTVRCTKVPPALAYNPPVVEGLGRRLRRRVPLIVAVVFIVAILVAAFWGDATPPSAPIYTAVLAAVCSAVLVACSLWGWTSAAQVYTYAAPAAVLSGAIAAVFDVWVIPDSALPLTVLVPVIVWWLYLAVFLGNVKPRTSEEMGLRPTD